jgi:hypothetical protein
METTRTSVAVRWNIQTQQGGRLSSNFRFVFFRFSIVFFLRKLVDEIDRRITDSPCVLKRVREENFIM